MALISGLGAPRIPKMDPTLSPGAPNDVKRANLMKEEILATGRMAFASNKNPSELFDVVIHSRDRRNRHFSQTKDVHYAVLIVKPRKSSSLPPTVLVKGGDEVDAISALGDLYRCVTVRADALISKMDAAERHRRHTIYQERRMING